MIICGYCERLCGYWKSVCGYWISSIPANLLAGQNPYNTPLRVLAGIDLKPNAYTHPHAHTHTCAEVGSNTRQYPQYPQRRSDLRISLRVLASEGPFNTRNQYPQTPQTAPRHQWEASCGPSWRRAA
jgi:hypothetical protein